MTEIWIALGALAAAAAGAVWAHNRLVRLRAMVEEGWSGIDVQLKRRAELIPNLVETVKAYRTHEQGTLRELAELRLRSLAAHGAAEHGPIEGAIGRRLERVFAVAEAYPELKANSVYLDLQERLSAVEDAIQYARRYYNGTVRDLNIAVESVPTNLVARPFGFRRADYFELDDEGDAVNPEVAL